MFNIACFMNIEFSKVLKSDWLRKPLATCKIQKKSNIYFQCSCPQPGRKTERRLDAQETNISQNHHTNHHFTILLTGPIKQASVDCR